MNVEYIDLGICAQAVWAASTVDEKKIALQDMIGKMQFRRKAEKFLADLKKLHCPKRLDRFASDLMLVDKDGVIKLT